MGAPTTTGEQLMAKTTWVIMKNTTYPHLINVPSIHMVGFKSKKEAVTQCNLLNERSRPDGGGNHYYIEQAKVFQPIN